MSDTLERLIQPGIRMMQQLRLPAKFLLISTAFMVPLGITLYAVVHYANVGIEAANSERQGTAYLKHMNQLLNRIVSARSANAQLTLSREMLALQQQAKEDHDALKVQASLATLEQTATSQESIAQLLDLYGTVGDNSSLILDPDLDSYYTMTVAVDYGPKLVDASALLGQRLASLRSANTATPQLTADIRYLANRLESLQSNAQQSLRRAAQANPGIATRLDNQEWQQAVAKLLALANAAEAGSISDTEVQIASVAAAASEQSLQMTNTSKEVLDELLSKRIDGLSGRRNFFLLLSCGCLLVSAYLITSFYLCNLRGFSALVTRMQKLANGDLTVNYPARGGDEIGVLIDAFNDSRAQLQVLVERIRHAADTISTAGQEIAAANMDLAQRGSTQSAVIGETAERVKHIAEKVQANLDGSSNANHIAESAFHAAEHGKTVVDNVVTTMDAMTGSSRRIGAIIDVINEIAFQTNLLALNAAVEAARAGEQGRGFAVVAGEVRHLAQRCATAANEITQLIKASVDDVDKGVNQVAKAGASMDEILGSVRSVSNIMGEMATASRTQADAILVVDKAVSRIDDDAQQNAALVEETAAAADLLREQVSVLMESVGHFTLGSTRSDSMPVTFSHHPAHAQPDRFEQAA
ncbi:MAG: methyl-accepting chemotaxis protein [Steroidobacteraceae bacterium]